MEYVPSCNADKRSTREEIAISNGLPSSLRVEKTGDELLLRRRPALLVGRGRAAQPTSVAASAKELAVWERPSLRRLEIEVHHPV